jgi:hypothetical protein
LVEEQVAGGAEKATACRNRQGRGSGKESELRNRWVFVLLFLKVRATLRVNCWATKTVYAA